MEFGINEIRKKYLKTFFIISLILFILFIMIDTNLLMRHRKKDFNNRFDSSINDIEMRFGNAFTFVHQLQQSSAFIEYNNTKGQDYYAEFNFYKYLNTSCLIIAKYGINVGINLDKSDKVIDCYNIHSKVNFYADNHISIDDLPDISDFYSSNLSYDRTLIFGDSDDGIYKINLFSKYTNRRVGKFYSIISLDYDYAFKHLNDMPGSWYIYNKNSKDLKYLSGTINNKKEDMIIKYINRDIERIFGYNIKTVFSTQTNTNYIYIDKSIDFFDFTIERLLSYLLMISFSLLLIKYGTKYFISQTYNPISKIIDNIEIENDSQLEFEELDGLIQVLKERVNNSPKSKELINQKIMKDLVLGIDTPKSYIDQVNKEIKGYDETKFAVLIKFEIEKDAEFPHANNILTLAISRRISEFNFNIMLIDLKSIVIVFHNNNLEDVIHKLQYELIAIEKRYNIKLFATVGTVCQDIKEINTSYNTALKLQNYKHILLEKRVVTETDIEDIKITKNYFNINQETNLIYKTVEGNYNAVKTIVDKIFDDNFIKKNYDKNNLRNFNRIIVNTTTRILSQLSLPYNKYKDDIVEIMIVDNPVILKDFILKLLSKIIDDNTNRLSKKQDETSTILMNYIKANHHKDISLDDLAEHIGQDSKHTSYLFKKLIGNSFKKVLNKYRIDKAKEMMQNDNTITTKEMAKKLGFNSDSSFIRAFKQYEGVSPKKYIQKFEL